MRKILIALVSITAVTIGVVGLSAFEAHIVNVTAKIENALKVDTDKIEFGTVFPQEYFLKNFWIKLSSSFLAENRVDDVDYVIKQKLKPCPVVDTKPIDLSCVMDTTDATPHNPTGWHYPNLCPFLSKLKKPIDSTLPTDNPPHDVGVLVPHSPGAFAKGYLTKLGQDTRDGWDIDLKVPCFRGMKTLPTGGEVYVNQCDQDYPLIDPVLDPDDEGKTFGCDLWIEVTGISRTPGCGGSPC